MRKANKEYLCVIGLLVEGRLLSGRHLVHGGRKSVVVGVTIPFHDVASGRAGGPVDHARSDRSRAKTQAWPVDERKALGHAAARTPRGVLENHWLIMSEKMIQKVTQKYCNSSL